MPLAARMTSVRRAFGGAAVLEGMDLSLRAGEFVSLLGRSGSGKSTLLRILAGLDRPDEGQVSVAGSTAIAFQEARLLPWETVARNVAMGLRSREARGRVKDALAEVGLQHRGDAWPGTLSGGEAQRASLARALVREPDLLLLDEPFGALDALTRIAMHDLVLDLWARHRPAVFMVTHDIDEAIKLSDRVLVIDRGRIALELSIARRDDGSIARDVSAAVRARLLEALGVSRESTGQGRATSRPLRALA